MTDKVSPSSGHLGDPVEAAYAIRYSGANSVWVPSGSDTPTQLASDDGDITNSNLNSFAETSSTSSFDVTIDGGEAFVGGAWLARDTTTTVTLASSTNNQTVYVGWDISSGDSVIIGLDSAFDSGDPKTEIWEFDTDGSGVTSSTDKRTTNEPASGGIIYVQSSEPSGAVGDNWLDTDTGIYRAYADLGNGANWHPIPPVTVLEEASTFAESDVTVTHNTTTISGGSIELGKGTSLASTITDDFESGDLVVESSNWADWSGDTGSFSAQQSTVIVDSWSGELNAANDKVTVDTIRSSTVALSKAKCRVQIDNQSTNSSDEVSVSLGVDSSNDFGPFVRFKGDGDIDDAGQNKIGTWSIDTDYRITFDIDYGNDQYDLTVRDMDAGSDIVTETNLAFQSSISEIDDFRFTVSTSVSGDTTNGYLDEVQVDVADATSGDALVEWDSAVPADIKSYDLATFQRTLDGETVTIDVEDGSGNVLFSDIGQNFDISTVDTSKEVKLRANLSRNDTSNNPTCDYLARRFTR